MMFFYVLGCYRLNFIVLDGKLAAGHRNKDRNPYCICLVRNFPNMTNHKTILQGGKYGCPLIFLKQKSFLRPPVINFRC
jgi:hypothetical protein